MDQTSPPDQGGYRPWLHRFSVLWVGATFALVVLGGVVTSKGLGLAVPDWPTTYNQNMFLFPLSMWKGGVFWEHTHRLLGSLVGLLTIGITVSLWVSQRPRPWLRWMGVGALIMVIVQGVMGGLRVTELSTWLAILHGVTAQLFLCMAVLITAALSRWWINSSSEPDRRRMGDQGTRAASRVRTGVWVLFAAMVVQLILGAGVRHTGARLAVPDFPSAYGSWVPPATQRGVDAAIDRMPYEDVERYYTVGQVWHHYLHRAWAVVVLLISVMVLGLVAQSYQGVSVVLWPAALVAGLMAVQPVLGASIVLTGDWAHHDEVATTHQAAGAALLAAVFLLALRVGRIGGQQDVAMTGFSAERPRGATDGSARWPVGAATA